MTAGPRGPESGSPGVATTSILVPAGSSTGSASQYRRGHSGRAARNINGEVIMYADHVTESMASTIKETERRRTLQAAYNAEHGITPESIRSHIHELLQTVYERDYVTVEVDAPGEERFETPADLARRIGELEGQMREAARRLDFEQAAELRDRVRSLKKLQTA